MLKLYPRIIVFFEYEYARDIQVAQLQLDILVVWHLKLERIIILGFPYKFGGFTATISGLWTQFTLLEL